MRNDFLIWSFFIGYNLSFGLVRLWTIQLSARAGTHIECRCSRAEDLTITDVIIKTPEKKWTGVRMKSCPEAMGWEFWFLKKAVSWDLTLDKASWDLNLGEASWFLSLGKASPVGAYGMHRAFVGSDGTVSIVKIVSLSLSLWQKPKSQGNKSFVPELKKVVSVSGFLCICICYIKWFQVVIFFGLCQEGQNFIHIDVLKWVTQIIHHEKNRFQMRAKSLHSMRIFLMVHRPLWLLFLFWV